MLLKQLATDKLEQELPNRVAWPVANRLTPRVKLPKTFLAVNLSDAFSFQEKERNNSEGDILEMKHVDRKISTPVDDELMATEAEETGTTQDTGAETASTETTDIVSSSS
jgi:inositol hexakisphosphate/diphosphoinositol-pentakisphosphate kinase